MRKCWQGLSLGPGLSIWTKSVGVNTFTLRAGPPGSSCALCLYSLLQHSCWGLHIAFQAFPSQSNSELLEPKISARGKPVRPAGRSLQLLPAVFPYACSSSRAGSGQCKREEMAWMMQEFPWLCQPSPQQPPEDCICHLIPTPCLHAPTPGISKKLWLQISSRNQMWARCSPFA